MTYVFSNSARTLHLSVALASFLSTLSAAYPVLCVFFRFVCNTLCTNLYVLLRKAKNMVMMMMMEIMRGKKHEEKKRRRRGGKIDEIANNELQTKTVKY